MDYDVLIIGAGLAGLSAASLLAKSGLRVCVVEQCDTPGGSCGIFKREGAIFDQGSSMLYGFGPQGFNAHRFLFNCLEEPFVVTKHELLYVVHYAGKQIRFWPDVDRFIEELSDAFPDERVNIRRFYKKMQRLYRHVMTETPSYTTADETNPKEAMRSVLHHPLSYIKFLSYLNISAEQLLKRYFKGPEILRFFDKLTSTYCYATVSEAPAILASVMFIDNHEGGSYYPAGSTLFLPGTLEKCIEAHGGEMIYDRRVTQLLFDKETPCGVLLDGGETIHAKDIVFSGTVWSLYNKLLAEQTLTEQEKALAVQEATYPSVVLYALVAADVIPPDTCPIEMLAANPCAIDESEITVYLPSIDDHTICSAGRHVVISIGPSFTDWDSADETHYAAQKQQETDRLLEILEQRFAGFGKGLIYSELATPRTLYRYTLKDGGAVAGPKQKMGQHLLKRQPIRTRWNNLFCCGESTTMGTGTPTVTTSGIAAANAVLQKRGLAPFVWQPQRKNYVQIITPPVTQEWMTLRFLPQEISLIEKAQACLFCTKPCCCDKTMLDIPGVLRRTACGNFVGARKAIAKASVPVTADFLHQCEQRCTQAQTSEGAVLLQEIFAALI